MVAYRRAHKPGHRGFIIWDDARDGRIASKSRPIDSFHFPDVCIFLYGCACRGNWLVRLCHRTTTACLGKRLCRHIAWIDLGGLAFYPAYASASFGRVDRLVVSRHDIIKNDNGLAVYPFGQEQFESHIMGFALFLLGFGAVGRLPHSLIKSSQAARDSPTFCVTRWWAGRENAALPEPASSHRKCLKTRRLPPVGCTLCWAFSRSKSFIWDNHEHAKRKSMRKGVINPANGKRIFNS